ncbi:MAG TPA: hypothetical protein VFO01_14485 [Trebonia sp.]|nr:hypothetical protein [Trebonia sp.]
MAPDQESLEELLGARRSSARAELAEAMCSLAAGDQAPEGLLAAAPASAFFEPRLYTQLVHPDDGTPGMTLEQLLFASVPEGRCAARTDAAGVACLPGLGRCPTPYPDAVITTRFDGPAGTVTVRHGDAAEVEVPWLPCTVVPGTIIEIVGHADPVLGAFLARHLDGLGLFSLVPAHDSYDAVLAAALQLIGEVRPAFHSWLLESLRAILLFRHPSAESFAALGMHGMIFLNVPAGAGLAYFVAELTHQGGHVVFSEATLDRADFLQADPDREMSDITGEADSRSVYDAFHGLYTEHMESQVMLAVLRAGGVDVGDVADFEQHLAEVMRRHRRDVELFRRISPAVFTGPGQAVFTVIERAYREAAAELAGGRPAARGIAASLGRSQ